MKGLSNILAQIENETAEKVKDIKAAAQKTADETLVKAKHRAETEAEVMRANAEVKYKDILSRSDSANELKIKREILAKKQELINQTMNMALDKLVNLPDSEYFDLILKLAKRYAHSYSGEIILSEKDKKRMPSDFETKLEGIKVSDKSINADGGFILSYGDIEENCTFKAIFESKREEMLTHINKLLFE